MHSRRSWIIVLALAAFAVARMTGAHLHMCFDGSEPPLSLHTEDGTHLEHHAGESVGHDDLDVEPVGDLLAKTAQAALLALAPLAILLIALLAPWRLVTVAQTYLEPRYPPPRFFRPPLRGPPA